MSTAIGVGRRPRVDGKFLAVGDERLWVKGATYGTFRPNARGGEYRDPGVVERDFAAMAAAGLNAVRTYTVPPRWLLDAAARHGLRVMVGLPWEQHVAFLDDPGRAASIEARVRAGVAAGAGHPAVLCYAVGNEIPAPIVRWHGHRRIERHVERLYRAAKAEDPGGLVTYVNYPTTEYLELPFLDLVCFNVYLESEGPLASYLARLHNLAGERPLLMAEIGLDSRRPGEAAQALALDGQIRAAFGAGCAGAFVFAWTDEWHRGGHDVEDWDFGLTRRDRRPKPGLAAAREAFAAVPLPKNLPWPRVSVVVCSYNGARTIADCLEGMLRLEYPDFEVIVVDDGSTDDTSAIARRYGFRVIRTENRGLSSARNTGMRAASAEIVTYTDDDARPDPHWLTFLAATFMTTTHAAVGGPNIAPPGDGAVADCVANAPGGPVHVLLSDQEAEHIPGCNMAFRKTALEAIGGFDPRFRTAGDDVDVCWRIQETGGTIGFNPAAVVWHHRRSSIRAYWKQQRGYGRAEALLEAKWRDRHNAAGHVAWAGRIYGRGVPQALGWRRARIYQGTWGSAPFQAMYHASAPALAAVALVPEWYLLIAALAALAALGLSWSPLLRALPLLAVAIAAPVAQACLGAARAALPGASGLRGLGLRGLTAWLYLLQPLARLVGRLRHGLTLWRPTRGIAAPWPRRTAVWSERWRYSATWLEAVEAGLRACGVAFRRGGGYDGWDLEVRGGLLGAARTLMAVEEHGAGRQLARFRSWPRLSPWATALGAVLAALAAAAGADRAWVACAALGVAAALLTLRAVRESGAALAAIVEVLETGDVVRAAEPERPGAGLEAA